jgi:hypothetical protein
MKNIFVTIAAYAAAIILLQTLYFKFTAQPESVYIFSKLGVEPYGRIGSGILELIAGVLLIVPKTRIWGSFLGLGIISGAIFSHLFILGITVQDDGGSLFGLAVAVFVCCLFVLIMNKTVVIDLLKKTFRV